MLQALDNGTTECSLSSSSSTSSSRISIASISVSSSSDEEMSDQSSQASAESDDEIPIWVNREQRWISGITGQTTCGQLIEVLLRNEGMLTDDIDAELCAETVAQYVITERWRRVEQMLDNRTKVMKIWKAWGQTRQEVCIHTQTILSLFQRLSLNQAKDSRFWFIHRTEKNGMSFTLKITCTFVIEWKGKVKMCNWFDRWLNQITLSTVTVHDSNYVRHRKGKKMTQSPSKWCSFYWLSKPDDGITQFHCTDFLSFEHQGFSLLRWFHWLALDTHNLGARLFVRNEIRRSNRLRFSIELSPHLKSGRTVESPDKW